MRSHKSGGSILGAALLAFLAAAFTARIAASPGALDTTYGPIVTGGAVNAMALQPDGRVVIGGVFTAVNGSSSRSHLARLFADGSLDPTFFNSGSGVAGTVSCLALQPDRRMVIGGAFTAVNGAPRTRVARLNADGSVDGSFVPSTAIGGTVLAAAAQGDNKVVIGGSFTGGTFPSWNARLNADGTTDTAFSSIPNGAVNAVAIQSDGKIVIGGAFTTVNGAARNRIARLNADGSLDNAFLNGLAGANALVRCVQIQPDGKILIGGDMTAVNGTARGSIARLNSNGSLDTGFSSTPGASGPVYAMALQSDSSVVIGGGFTTYASFASTRVARLRPDGSRDASFAAVGINNLVQALAVQGDGGILAGGTFTAIGNVNLPFMARLYGDVYPPEFLTQPASRSTNVGATVVFSALVNNPTPSTYQWRKDGNTIPSATGLSYTLFNVQLSDAGAYSVFVSNAAGGSTSSNALLKVGIAPAFTSQPSSLIVTQGQSASFAFSATGTPLSYSWSKNGVPIAGATNATFAIERTVGGDAATYSVAVSNFLTTITSTGAVLTVNVPASITTPPASQIVGEGEEAIFTVSAEGTDLAYQWFKGDQSIPGATAPSYTITNARFSDEGDFSVTVSNHLAVATSLPARLTLRRIAPVITAQPISQNIAVGSNVTLTVVATGTTLNFQWRKDQTNMADATGPSLSLAHAALEDIGGYTVVVSNSLDNVTSEVAFLNVGYAPVIVQPPLSVTNLPGGAASFSCTVTGSPPIRLQWVFNDAPIPNQTNATLTLTNLRNADFGFYAIAATNIFGGVISSNAELRDPIVWTWTPTGSLGIARSGHTATLLADGSVLVVGGVGGPQSLVSAELYDPVAGTWTPTGPLNTTRRLHTATLLPNGKVLVAGGADDPGVGATAEIFDPLTKEWQPTEGLNTNRYAHTATLLPNGSVLIAAGVNPDGFLAASEFFDPVLGKWSLAGAAAESRSYHSAILLSDGNVVVVGGYNGNVLASADEFAPSSGTWAPSGSMTTARWFEAAALLANGKVIVTGGTTPAMGNGFVSVELYDPSLRTWAPAGSLLMGRFHHSATLLPSGQVLVVGGVNGGGALASVERYDPDSGAWTATRAMETAREQHTATLLRDGRVLVVGGLNSSGSLASAEIFGSSKIPAAVNLTNLVQLYDGSGKHVTPITIPPGLAVDLTYNGLLNAPTNAGSYAVIGTINDLNYLGGTTNTFVILPAPSPIALAGPILQSDGSLQFTFNNVSGASFSVLATTQIATPLPDWTVLGPALETPPGSGLFQYIAAPAVNASQRFFLIRSP